MPRQFVPIFCARGFARDAIRMESLPAGDKTGFPVSSYRTFSSFPTIMNGAAWVCAPWDSAQAKANIHTFLDGMNFSPRLGFGVILILSKFIPGNAVVLCG